MSIWQCEDCGWRWPLHDVPYQDAECDACGGTMTSGNPVCARCGYAAVQDTEGRWIHDSVGDAAACELFHTGSAL